MKSSRPATAPVLLLIFLAALAAQVRATTPSVAIESVKIYDVSEDSTQSPAKLRASPEVWDPYLIWESVGQSVPNQFEIKVRLKQQSTELASDTISLHFPATYQVFYNDSLIAENGKLSPTFEEIEAGRSIKDFALPSTPLDSEKRILRIRGSHTHSLDTNHAFILSIRPLQSSLHFARSTAINYSFYIVFALFGIYLLAYYFVNRKAHQYLLLASTCIFFGIYAFNKLVYYQINVPYVYLDYIGYVANSSNFALSIAATATLLYTFGIRKKLVYLICFVPYLLTKTIDYLAIIPATAYTGLGLSIAALLFRRKQAFFALIVSSIMLLNYELPILSRNQAYGFSVLMLLFLVSIINLLIRENRERNQAQLHNTRLQLELLKSKIQPHFVLNSLTSAIEWIETNPKQGVKLIQELAKEFDLLSSISDKKLIPLATEIESCETYLRIMEYRKKASYTLTLRNVNLSESIPPSILRNLVENAISHNGFGEESITFELSQSQEGDQRALRFSAPLAEKPLDASTAEDGTGIRYIKARLAESYKTWTFEHGPENGHWVSTIKTPVDLNPHPATM